MVEPAPPSDAGGYREAQVASLRVTEHRPWPLPGGPWIMGQSWVDLLFAHWEVPADELRRLLPEGLDLDTYEGRAFVGVTPFVMRGLRPRLAPAVRGVSDFLELNVRTYVVRDDRPGILFFTLEASSRLAVAAARALYRLPYARARMRVRADAGFLDYRSERPGGEPPRLQARYAGDGPVFHAAPGTLDHFLTERYRLYAAAREGLWYADIHHGPWPLQRAAPGCSVELVPPPPLRLAGEPLLHLGRRVDVVVWPLRRVS